MKSTLRFSLVAAMLVGFCAYAQEDEEGEELDDAAAEALVPGARAPKKEAPRYFTTLPFCRLLEGRAEVLKPASTEWEPIEEGRFYPLGTTYRSLGSGSRLTIKFGNDIEVAVVGEATFGTKIQPLGEQTRTITLLGGTLKVKVPRKDFSNGVFCVSAPGFKTDLMLGESKYTYRKTGDGDEATVRCVTGALTVQGRHFIIGPMRAAQEFRVRTSQDCLFTGIYGQAGDCMVKLEQGQVNVKDFETGETHVQDKSLDWKLSPRTAVRIHRAMPSIGERLSVSILTFDAAGELRNRCAFAEKRPEVNSGELGPVNQKGKDALAKKAAEAAETGDASQGDLESDTADEGGSEAEGDGEAGDEDEKPAEKDPEPAVDEDDFDF